MESATPLPKPMVVLKATDRLRRLLYDRPLLMLTIMLCTGVVIILWHISRLQTNLIESVTLNNASLYAQALEEFRTLYTSEVAVRARMQGIEVTHDYDVKAGAIPLPATLSLLLGQHIAAKGTGGELLCSVIIPFLGVRTAVHRTTLRNRRCNTCGNTQIRPLHASKLSWVAHHCAMPRQT